MKSLIAESSSIPFGTLSTLMLDFSNSSMILFEVAFAIFAISSIYSPAIFLCLAASISLITLVLILKTEHTISSGISP
jgi:hypothetical protein